MIADAPFYAEKIMSQGGHLPSENYEMDLVDMIRLHFKPLDCQANGAINISVLKPNRRRGLELEMNDMSWSRMVVLLHTKHPLLYHRVADSFACNNLRYSKCFEASGELYGEYMHGMPVPPPPGKICRALVNQLRDLIEISRFPIMFSP